MPRAKTDTKVRLFYSKKDAAKFKKERDDAKVPGAGPATIIKGHRKGTWLVYYDVPSGFLGLF